MQCICERWPDCAFSWPGTPGFDGGDTPTRRRHEICDLRRGIVVVDAQSRLLSRGHTAFGPRGTDVGRRTDAMLRQSLPMPDGAPISTR